MFGLISLSVEVRDRLLIRCRHVEQQAKDSGSVNYVENDGTRRGTRSEGGWLCYGVRLYSLSSIGLKASTPLFEIAVRRSRWTFLNSDLRAPFPLVLYFTQRRTICKAQMGQ